MKIRQIFKKSIVMFMEILVVELVRMCDLNTYTMFISWTQYKLCMGERVNAVKEPFSCNITQYSSAGKFTGYYDKSYNEKA